MKTNRTERPDSNHDFGKSLGCPRLRRPVSRPSLASAFPRRSLVAGAANRGQWSPRQPRG